MLYSDIILTKTPFKKFETDSSTLITLKSWDATAGSTTEVATIRPILNGRLRIGIFKGGNRYTIIKVYENNSQTATISDRSAAATHTVDIDITALNTYRIEVINDDNQPFHINSYIMGKIVDDPQLYINSSIVNNVEQ